MNYTHFAWQEFPQGKPTMYQPTEQELLEMGFRSYKLYFILDVCDLRIVCWFDDYLAKIHWGWTIFAREDAEADDSIMAKIYPRSKEHLEQIILAFKP